VTALALVLFASAALAQDAPAHPGVDLKGKLYRAVFVNGPGALTAADLAALPEPVRERLRRFLDRRAAFKSQYIHEAGSFDQVRADAKRRDIERAIVALLDADGIEKLAVDFVDASRISGGWEGKALGPLGEAAAAEDFLKRNPSSVLAPYLYLFIAHRQRAAFEVNARAQNVEGMKAASKKYRTFLQRARSATDPIFALTADDLDRQSFIYLKTDTHPGTFDPDA
jgi:hypothetical protein